MAQSTGAIVAIDLGTACARVGAFKGDRVEIFTDDHGNCEIPAFVAFTNSAVLVGEAAKKQAEINPANTVFDAMRLLGIRYSDPSIHGEIKLWPFKLTPGIGGRAMITVQHKGKTFHFAPEEICSLLIMKLKRIAETHLKTTVKSVVVTVPVFFNQVQRRAIKHAGAIAGLEIKRLISGTSAAVLAYGPERLARSSRIFTFNLSGCKHVDHNVVIFHLGAGTLDVSLLNIKENVCKVKATSGDAHLGGQDFINRMMKHFIELIRTNLKRDIRKNPRVISSLRSACQKMKKVLSDEVESTEIVTLYDDFGNPPKGVKLNISRRMFEDLNKDLLRSCLEHVEKCLKDGRMDKRMVDEIILVGGSTKIPKLREVLSRYFNGKELCMTIDPFEAVVSGASVLAATLSNEKNRNVRSFSLTDATSFSFGIKTAERVPTVTIPRNTPIPTKKKIVFRRQNYGEQSSMAEVYEGERGWNRDNNLLGSIGMSGINPSPKGEVIVYFEINQDGVLTVSNEDVTSGLKKNIAITNNDNNWISLDESKKRVWEALNEEKVNDMEKKIASANSSKVSTPYHSRRISEREMSMTSSMGREKDINYHESNEIAAFNESGIVIGIDLGTTYSCVGVLSSRRVKIIENEYGNRKTRSCVAFTDTERLVGDAANKDQGNVSLIVDVKRLMGRRYSDNSIHNNMRAWPFKVISDADNRPLIQVQYKGKEKRFLAEEISAMILTKMKSTAESFLRSIVSNAVITVPACFTDSQRQATFNAGRIAGFNAIRLLSETTATAITYHSQKLGRESFGSKTVLIFDLGGGTFDVSILAISGNSIKVLAVSGDTNLGGEDFDTNMVDYFVREFMKKHKKDVSTIPRALRRLRKACERAKRVLSTNLQTMIEIDALCGKIDFQSVFTRASFEELNADLFRRCMDKVESCIRDAKMDRNSIDEIVMVGGASRIPKVQRLVQEFFNGSNICKSVNPDEAIAHGATILASVLTNNKDNKKLLSLDIPDVIPFSLGSETSGGSMGVLIPRNTKIPTRKEFSFTTSYDNQESICINICECELENNGDDNGLLAKYVFSDIPPYPRAIPKIGLIIDIDENGIINVGANNMTTNENKELPVSKNGGYQLREQEIKKMMREAEKYKKEDEQHKERAAAMNSLEDYAIRMRVMGNNMDDSSLERLKILEAAERAVVWLEGNQRAGMADYENKLSELRSLVTDLCAR
ncbi:hypothetical protein LUZ60_011404 [Juncus effusus]|nr:hypothetical protein LUZ60_011404 [Juncus effusus]